MKKIIFFFIKLIIALGSVGLSIVLIFKVIGNMGEDFQEANKNVMAKTRVDMARAMREAEQREALAQSAYQIAQRNKEAQHQAEIKAAEEQARKAELERFKREIAEHQAQESKKAEFEKEFKPREECNDPMLEWSKSVQCNNEKMTAKEKFYSSH